MRLVLAFLLIISLSGCMTLVTGGETDASISISSDPPDATAACGGQIVRTPGVLVLDRRVDHIVQVTAPGYRPTNVKIESHQNVQRWILSVVLNATHGFFTLGISFVAGLAIDYGSGALQDLAPASELVPLFRWETAPIVDGQQRDPTEEFPPPTSPPPR